MRTNKFLAVIHAVSSEQALRNARVAFGEGADGIFLINHDIAAHELRQVYGEVREEYPDAWIGLNYLGLSQSEAIHALPLDVNAIWIDDAGISNGPDTSLARGIASLMWERARKHGARPLYFGGVAFKYVHRSKDPARDAALAALYVDVVTTSGAATGFSPSVEKVFSMREALDQELGGRLANPMKLLAVASGMTTENVDPFLEYVDYFLVATGVSHSHTELDPVRVAQFAKKMRR